jgi:hypothetical protein
MEKPMSLFATHRGEDACFELEVEHNEAQDRLLIDLTGYLENVTELGSQPDVVEFIKEYRYCMETIDSIELLFIETLNRFHEV